MSNIQFSLRTQKRSRSQGILSILLLLLCISCQPFLFIPTAQATSLVTSSDPPEDLASAGVSLVRLLAIYEKLGSHPLSAFQCTGLGILVDNWTSAPPQQNTSILTDGNLLSTHGSSTCAPAGLTLTSVQIFFNKLYNNRQPIVSPQSVGNAFAVTCQDTTTCSNGLALFSYHSPEPLPFVDLSQETSTTNVFGLSLGAQPGSATLPTAPQVGTQVPLLLTPNHTLLNGGAFQGESGAPVVDPQGHLLGIHLSNGEDSTIQGIQSFLQQEHIATHPETVLQQNWRLGVVKYYEKPVDPVAAKAAFQKAFSANTQFEAANDFASRALSSGSNINGNGGITPVRTSVATTQPNSSFFPLPDFLFNPMKFGPLSFPFWVLIVGVILVLLILVAIISLLRTALHRRKQYVATELKAAMELHTFSVQSPNWQQPTLSLIQPNPISQPSTTPHIEKSIQPVLQHCPRCGESVPDKALYCPNCQLPLKSGETRSFAQSAASPLPIQPHQVVSPPIKPDEAKESIVQPEQKPVQAIPENIDANNIPQPSPVEELPPHTATPSVVAKQERQDGDMKFKGKRLGNYRLLRVLGEGAFAEVYLAEQVYIKTQAAIKVLRKRLTRRELVGFVEESRTVANLIHPHIVRVLEFGLDGHEIDLEQSIFEVEGSIPYLVMDYAPGGTLRTRYPKGTRLPPATIISYVKQIADALDYAHNNKLIHLDVKPENMLIGRSDQVLLSDFGISAVAHSDQSIDTREAAGTAPYMAPEQIRGKPRPASDQYALAIVVYEWLCGTRPFHGASQWEILEQHLYRQPVSPREKLALIPPEADAVILKALNKDPQQRFTNVKAFANALEHAFHLE